MMQKPNYHEALDIVATILGVNAKCFSSATINMVTDTKRYLATRDSIAKVIVRELGFIEPTKVK